MALNLEQPPKEGSPINEWSRWFLRLWKWVRGQVQLVDDAAATIGCNTTYVGVTAISAPRTLTLPAPETMQDGDEIVFQDESGSAGAHTITISGAINGGTSTTIASNYGRKRIVKRGAGYFSA